MTKCQQNETYAFSKDDLRTFAFVLRVRLKRRRHPHCDVADDQKRDKFAAGLQKLMSPLVAASSQSVREEQRLELTTEKKKTNIQIP